MLCMYIVCALSITHTQVQRCGSIAPIGIGNQLAVTTDFRGYTLPAGTWVIPHLTNVLHNERYFHKADQFKAERFLENGKLMKKPEMIPFLIGL